MYGKQCCCDSSDLHPFSPPVRTQDCEVLPAGQSKEQEVCREGVLLCDLCDLWPAGKDHLTNQPGTATFVSPRLLQSVALFPRFISTPLPS